MTDTFYFKGKSCSLYLRTGVDTKKKFLVKKTGLVEEVHSHNAALYNEFEILKDLRINGLRKAIAIEAGPDGPELILEYCEGLPINKAFNQIKGNLKLFLKAAVKITKILEEVHHNKIIHRDINPSNILYHPDTGLIHLIDFGISSKLDLKVHHLGNPDKLEGSLHYMSPEQSGRMDRVIDSRSDLYSLGITFYELLTGKKPFDASTTLEIVHAHIAIEPKPIYGELVSFADDGQTIPEIMNRIVMKLLEKNAENRYQSASGLKYDLQKCLDSLNSTGTVGVFEISQYDHSGVFRIPEKLYGMESQIQFLKEKFLDAEKGKTKMVLISGNSGVGKSALVRELHQLLGAANGMFISGKFDQLKKSIPHLALVEALNELTALLCNEENKKLEKWKVKILRSVDGLGSVLTDLIPSLENIIGPQPEVPELSSVESQNRRDYLLRNFLKCFVNPGQPLLVFIDDLQWADEASLDLFKKLLIDRSLEGLLFIGAYRENEIHAGHPLLLTMNEIEEERTIERINIGNLKLSSVEALVSDTLACDKSEIAELAALIYKKTAGNGFFVLQFLKSVHDNDCIFYDSKKQKWVWKLSKIDEMGITDNVVDLLNNKIAKLDNETIETLKVASCIGNRFNLSALSLILNKELAECLRVLRIAISEDLIYPLGNQTWMLNFASQETSLNTEFAFRHDRIQETVYLLIPESERQILHLRIGRILISSVSEQTMDQSLYSICNHVNWGVDLLENEHEILNIANYNAIAGRKARQSGAYAQALTYLDVGISLLPEQAWLYHYDLWLRLFVEAMESAFLIGDHDKMEILMESVLEHGANILDKMPVYNIKVDAYTAQNDLPKAVQAGVEALSKLGVKFPSKPTIFHVFKDLGAIKMKLFNKKVESLIDLPEMTNPYMLEAMPLMERISPAAYMSGSQLFPLLVFKMVDLSLKYGNSSLSAFGYASYAITLSGVLGDYDGGYRFANLSMKLLERFQDKTYVVKVYFVNYCFIRHWKEHSRDMVSPLMDAYRSGMQVGNLFSGTWVACYALLWKYYGAYKLTDLQAEVGEYAQYFRQLKQDGAFNLADILHRTISKFTDRGEVSTELGDEVLSESDLLKRCKEANDKTSIFFFYLNKMQLSYLFGKCEEVRQYSISASEHIEAVVGLPYIPQFYFYDALFRFGVASPSSKDRKKIKANLKKLRTWAKHAPMNYSHKFHLVQAEWYRLNGENEKARITYDEAIQEAHENKYLQEEALAYERAYYFYKELGVKHMSTYMLREATNAWYEWGAFAKLNHLNTLTKTLPHKNNTTRYQNLKTGTSSSLLLDMESILKASNILSSEIVLENLINHFMKIMIENIGANRGVLLLKDNEEWSIRAIVNVNEESVQLLETQSDEEILLHPLLPSTIINYIINSKDKVLINDLDQDHNFVKDQYIIENAPKSLIGFPLINKMEIIGILYLENTLVKGVFHEERLELLNILGSQVAVSIENARLYSRTKALNVAYERFVPKQFLSFLEKKSITEVRLGDQVQKEMTILFSDIRGFTSLSEKLSPQDNFNFINEYLSKMEPHISEYGGFIDKYIGDGIMALFPSGPDQALDASIAMLTELNRFNKENGFAKKSPISIGIGLHTGRMILGTIGGKDRMDSTVISDAVNIASRVEGLTKRYGASLLVTKSTLDKLSSPGQYDYRKISDVVVEGKTEALSIYEVFNNDDRELRALKKQQLTQFAEALKAYQSADISKANEMLDSICAENPQDKVAAKFLERCKKSMYKDRKSIEPLG